MLLLYNNKKDDIDMLKPRSMHECFEIIINSKLTIISSTKSSTNNRISRTHSPLPSIFILSVALTLLCHYKPANWPKKLSKFELVFYTLHGLCSLCSFCSCLFHLTIRDFYEQLRIRSAYISRIGEYMLRLF